MAVMPRVETQISTELYSRLKEYTAKSRGTLYCQESEVVAEAIKEYLDRHERKVRRANG
jgi:metal-responsive CopG/Arc/MetJ family transcriptional regulator